MRRQKFPFLNTFRTMLMTSASIRILLALWVSVVSIGEIYAISEDPLSQAAAEITDSENPGICESYYPAMNESYNAKMPDTGSAVLTQNEDAEAIPSQETEIKKDSDRSWLHLIKKGEFNVRDSTVVYPRFIKFCRDVYLWADKAFNSYDTAYVVGTGTKWKARLAYDAWFDSYHINLMRKMPITLISNPYNTAGIYIHYMAVSVSQQIDLSNLFFNKPVNHHKYEFNFNCARFNLDLSFNSNTGGSYIRSFGDYRKGKGRLFKQFFPGVSLQNFSADLYYYFNNRKYANGAAYYFSKVQKISAGSLMVGISYGYEDLKLDFTKLPDYLLPYMKIPAESYKFNYHSYNLLFGYGYNWVLGKHFLYNITIYPSIGVIHCSEDSSEGQANLFSLCPKGRMSITYNKDNFFICGIAKAMGYWYLTKKLSVFNSIANFSISLGVRF